MSTAVIGTIVFGLFVLVSYSIYKNSKKNSCGGNCPNCTLCPLPKKDPS